jgi:hypothetical protein
MKPLTKVAAWVWMGVIANGLAQIVYVRLSPVAIGPPWTRSPITLAVEAAGEVLLLVCAVALLRGRRWAWWVGVLLFGLAALGLPGLVWSMLPGRDAALPRWFVWDNLAQAVASLFILVALLLDRPRPGEPHERKDDLGGLVPSGNPNALAAYYLGLFSCFPFVGAGLVS